MYFRPFSYPGGERMGRRSRSWGHDIFYRWEDISPSVNIYHCLPCGYEWQGIPGIKRASCPQCKRRRTICIRIVRCSICGRIMERYNSGEDCHFHKVDKRWAEELRTFSKHEAKLYRALDKRIEQRRAMQDSQRET